MARRVRYRLSPDRVPSRSSRAVSSVAGSRPGWLVACGIVRRRIACRMARRRIASRRIPARVGDLGIPAVPPVWHPEVSSSAMPRPNSALSPTPPPTVYEHVFFSMAVPLYGGPFGGAAKRNRWAAQVKLCRMHVPSDTAHSSMLGGSSQPYTKFGLKISSTSAIIQGVARTLHFPSTGGSHQCHFMISPRSISSFQKL